MLTIEALETNEERIRLVFDVNGNKNREFRAITAIFDALIQKYFGVSINWNSKALTFGVYKDCSTEWIYWNTTGELEVNPIQ